MYLSTETVSIILILITISISPAIIYFRKKVHELRKEEKYDLEAREESDKPKPLSKGQRRRIRFEDGVEKDKDKDKDAAAASTQPEKLQSTIQKESAYNMLQKLKEMQSNCIENIYTVIFCWYLAKEILENSTASNIQMYATTYLAAKILYLLLHVSGKKTLSSFVYVLEAMLTNYIIYDLYFLQAPKHEKGSIEEKSDPSQLIAFILLKVNNNGLILKFLRFINLPKFFNQEKLERLHLHQLKDVFIAFPFLLITIINLQTETLHPAYIKVFLTLFLYSRLFIFAGLLLSVPDQPFSYMISLFAIVKLLMPWYRKGAFVLTMPNSEAADPINLLLFLCIKNILPGLVEIAFIVMRSGGKVFTNLDVPKELLLDPKNNQKNEVLRMINLQKSDAVNSLGFMGLCLMASSVTGTSLMIGLSSLPAGIIWIFFISRWIHMAAVTLDISLPISEACSFVGFLLCVGVSGMGMGFW